MKMPKYQLLMKLITVSFQRICYIRFTFYDAEKQPAFTNYKESNVIVVFSEGFMMRGFRWHRVVAITLGDLLECYIRP